MRRLLIVLAGAGSVAAAYACSTFESSESSPLADASDEAAEGADGDVAVDSGSGDDGGLSPDAPIIGIAAGQTGACAITNDGHVRCWGSNLYGAAGASPAGDDTCQPTSVYPDGGGGKNTEPCRATPTTVGGLLASERVTQTSLGEFYACARTYNQKLYCWGLNADARLGVPVSQVTATYTPQKVAISTVIDVTASGNFAFARAREEDGGSVVWSWGANESGQLALGTIADASVDGAPPSIDTEHPPTRTILPATAEVLAPAVGAAFACARHAFSILCWGRSIIGCLGHTPGTKGDVTCPTGPAGQFCNPTPLEVEGDFSSLENVSDFAACAVVNPTNQRLCWGFNGFGALAEGTTDVDNHGTPESASLVPAGTVSIAARYSHACALTSAGDVYCWGTNTYGEVGRSPADNVSCANSLHCQLAPKKVEGLPPIVAVDVGEFFSVALARDGSVWAWGSNAREALGHKPGDDGDIDCPNALPNQAYGVCNPTPTRVVFP